MKLIKTSVNRPVGVIMIVLAILALGFVSVRNLAVDLFPEIELPVAVVATSYEDAAPEDIENLISRPIESAVSTIEGIDTVQSQSQTGASLVMMMFKNGTDLDQALLDVRESIDQVKGFLPEQAGDPSILRFSPEAMPVMYIGLTGKDVASLTEIANNQIEPFLERQAGVASVTVEGAEVREIQVEIDPLKLEQYGVSTQSVVQAISESNQSASVGTVDRGNQDLQVRITGDYTSLDDIRETVIQTQAGATLHVEDIAEVKDTYKDTNATSLVNGEESLVLSIMKQTDANTVEVATGIQDNLSEIQAELGDEVHLDILIDTSEFITMSIDSVLQNIIIGGIISFLILLLFLKSIRATIIIGVSIPIALISTFALMYFTGHTLNVLTLGGLALGIGLMLDCSIIILENIYSYRQRGESIKDAAIKGATELTPAVIAATTTTLVVFLPMVFVEGIAADLFLPLAITVSFSLIAALVVAITLVPMLSSKLLKAQRDTGRRYWFDRFLDWLRNKYAGGLKVVLRFRKTTVTIVILSLVGSLALIPQIGAEFMPESDQGQAMINVEVEPGTKFEYTYDIVVQINDVLDNYQDVIDVNYVTVNSTDPTGMMGGGSGGASYTLMMVPISERDQSTTEIVKSLDEDLANIAGADITVSEMSGGMSMGDPIQIVLTGPEHEVLRDISEQVVEEISTIDGVFNPTTSAGTGIPQMEINIDEDKAAMYGLTPSQITGQVQMQFNGQIATKYREAGEEMDVTLIYPEDMRETIQDIRDVKIQTQTGTSIPLEEIATYEEVQGPVSLQRENQQPQLNVTSAVVDRDLASVVRDIDARLDAMNFPEEYSYSMGGQAEDMAESFGQLALALLFAIFLVYAVMAVQFENFLFPFIIMFALPTTVIGVILGFLVTGLSLSIPAFIGIIMLAGIVVNNSIVLVDYINILRRRGMDRYEAIIEAGRSRLRPILMTTLTTVLAMVPLGLALGEGAELQQPLAVTIIFGLSSSTIFTLFFVPVMYLILDNFTSKFTRRKKKKVVEEK